MVRKGQPLLNSRHPRPHVWRSGPDELDHAIYKTWATSRAQAHFRNEEWDLSWTEYRDIWRPDWHRRGRDGDNLCLSRMDFDTPWQVGNVELITRAENARRHTALRYEANQRARADGTYKTRRRNSGKK